MHSKNLFNRLVTWTTVLIMTFSLIWPGIAAAYTATGSVSTGGPIAEGVSVDNIKIQATDGNIEVYMMTVDLTNPYVRVDTLVGSNNTITAAKTVSNMAKASGAIGGINGDFFQMDENAPIGITVQSGNLVTSPVQRKDMYGFGLTKDNKPIFTNFAFQGAVTSPGGAAYTLFGINKPTYLADQGASSDVNCLNMYTPRWGVKSRGPVAGLTNLVEMVVDSGLVKEIRVSQPAADIPQNGYVLAGQGAAGKFLTDNFKVSDQVEVKYSVSPENDNLMAAIGGQALLVQNGQQHWFSQNITGKKARTAIGASQDGQKLYLVVVEGGNGSRGMTQEELADFMISRGVWTAMNLDGGGSSTMVARDLGDQTVSLLNTPVYNSERPVPTGIGIFSTAPTGPLAGIKIGGPQHILVKTTKVFLAKGYDQHFNPYTFGTAEVIWSISPNLGTFEGNVFTAVDSGDAVISASVGNVVQQYPVKILGSKDIAKIEVTPVNVALNPGESVNISVTVTTNQGAVFVLQPDEYDIQVKGDVGTVDVGRFVAGSQMGAGELVVTIDSTSVTTRVCVGSIEKPFYGFETARNLKFRGYPMGLTLGGFRMINVNEPSFRGAGAARLEYDFTKTSKTRAGYGNFEDTLPFPGKPVGLGLWVLGDQANGHWLRARILDASGKEKLVDFAREVNWKGWKHVKATIPSDVTYPVKLTDIYLVETDGGSQDAGVVYIDDLSLISAPTAEDLAVIPPLPLVQEQLIPVGKPLSMRLGTELRINFNNPLASPEYLITAEQIWNSDLPTPGYNPTMPLYSITGVANGDDAEMLPEPMKIQLQFKEANNLDAIRLMFWDVGKGAWIQIPCEVKPNTLTVTGKTNRLGIFGLMEDVHPLPNFSDTGTNWAKKLISEMAAKDIVKGFPDGKFLPAKGVTRAEFVTILANTLGWTSESTELKFKDSVPSWAAGSIASAVSKGVVSGYANGTFKPNRVITRAEMSVIIDKALGLPKSNTPSNYKDAKVIPLWAVQSIRNTKAALVLQGSGNKFRPQDIANRAEATAVMAKVLINYLNS